MKQRNAVAVGLIALVAGGACAAPALAAEPTPPAPVRCTTTIENQVVGTVTVPYGADCTLRNVLVDGDVRQRVDSGALTLDVVAVRGSLTSDAGGALSARLTAVRGVTELVEPTGAISLRGSAFGAGVTISGASQGGTIARNVVSGDVTIASSGAFALKANLIEGTLDCQSNDPAPTGSFNFAQQLLGQCSGL